MTDQVCKKSVDTYPSIYLQDSNFNKTLKKTFEKAVNTCLLMLDNVSDYNKAQKIY